MTEVRGQVVALGVPVRDVEVLAVAGQAVVATAVTDRDGNYRLDAARPVDRVVARFLEPFIGVAARPAGADIAADIVIDRADIVRLTGTLQPPAGIAFDWVDLKLTPRGEISPMVILHDPEGLREAYWIRRLVEPRFQLRVLRGTWDLRVHRIVDGPLTATPRVNLGTAAVILPDGSRPAMRLGGFEFAVDHDLVVTVELRALAIEEL
jgi:hypothetical protein